VHENGGQKSMPTLYLKENPKVWSCNIACHFSHSEMLEHNKFESLFMSSYSFNPVPQLFI